MAQFIDLIVPTRQSLFVQRRRAMLIISRVRMVAGAFALLTPLWMPVDLVMFDSPLGVYLALLRAGATAAFAGIVFAFRKAESMHAAHLALAWLLAIPTVFFLVSQPLLSQFEIVQPAAQVVASGYAYLPFVMLAGLSVFPITALEGVVLATPLLAAYLFITLADLQIMSFSSHLGALWLLILLSMVATLSGMSQLHFMLQLVAQASHDGLTRAYTRRVGEEFLDQQFSQSQRNDTPLAIAFVDLDKFKTINDAFGHEEGDNTLRNAAAALRRMLRRGDILIRWGGEEFLVVMPSTDCGGARKAVLRLRNFGLGNRPDGVPQTASIGVAERGADAIQTWPEMVEKADQRMYMAKQTGRDRAIVCGNEVIIERKAPDEAESFPAAAD